MKNLLLWSGGFDSTYLLLDMLNAGEEVTTLYIVQDLTWRKQRNEITARNKILELLPDNLKSKLTNMPLEPLPDFIWVNYWKFLNKLGNVCPDGYATQNAMLATLGYYYKSLIVGICADDRTAQTTNELKYLHDNNVLTPLLYLTKAQMLEQAILKGYMKYLELTWTCEAFEYEVEMSQLDTPCGKCEPCAHRIVSLNQKYLTAAAC